MDTNRFGRFDVLVVEPDASATASARTALEKLGARCFVVADLEGAKRCVAQHRIGGVILGPSVSTRAARELLDGLSFDRRRRPRLIRMSPRDPSAGRLGEHVADVLAYVPLLDSAVVAAVGMKESEGTPAGPTHAAALVRATSLPGGIGESMRDVASTLRMAFTADACVIVGTSFGDAWIVGTGASLSQTELVELRERVLGAARGRTVVVSSELVTRGAQGACGFESTLGARIIGPDNVRVGLIALVQRGFRAYRGDERELLDAFGRRLAIELSHRGVKDHLVAELDATREAGGLDPMLGVWSESTLLRLLEMMTASALRNKAPLTVAVVDVRELGRINDLYGHEAGDAVLKHVAELVVYIVRQSDVVARFRGGIAVVFDDTTPADAATVILVSRPQVDDEDAGRARAVDARTDRAGGAADVRGRVELEETKPVWTDSCGVGRRASPSSQRCKSEHERTRSGSFRRYATWRASRASSRSRATRSRRRRNLGETKPLRARRSNARVALAPTPQKRTRWPAFSILGRASFPT